jgi:hypothetical protein
MTFEEQGEPIQMSGEGVGNADDTRGRFDFTYRGEQAQFRMEGIVVADELGGESGRRLEYGVPVDVKPPPAHQVIEENVFDRLTGEG